MIPKGSSTRSDINGGEVGRIIDKGNNDTVYVL